MHSRRTFLTRAVGYSAATAAGLVLSSAFWASKASASGPAKAPKTRENLMTAFSGESQAYQKYMIFAGVAEKEGLTQVAKLFRATAEAEALHAAAHLRNAGKVGDTMENLKTAIAGETYEYTEMYPGMTKDASSEGEKKVESYFAWAGAAEKGHAELYQKALDAKGKIAETDYYVCKVCGYTHEGPHDGSCPICGMGSSAFFKA
jgi:Rubrerythrin